MPQTRAQLDPTPFPKPAHYFLSRSGRPSLGVLRALGAELEASRDLGVLAVTPDLNPASLFPLSFIGVGGCELNCGLGVILGPPEWAWGLQKWSLNCFTKMNSGFTIPSIWSPFICLQPAVGSSLGPDVLTFCHVQEAPWLPGEKPRHHPRGPDFVGKMELGEGPSLVSELGLQVLRLLPALGTPAM